MSYTPINSQSSISLYNLIGRPYGTPLWFVDQDSNPDESFTQEILRLVFNHSTGEWLLPVEIGMSYGIRVANLNSNGIAIPAYIGGLSDHVGGSEHPNERTSHQMWEIGSFAIGRINGIYNPTTQRLRRFRIVPPGSGESITEAVFGEYGTRLNSEIVVYQRTQYVPRSQMRRPDPFSKSGPQEALYKDLDFRGGEVGTGLDEEEQYGARQTGKTYLTDASQIAMIHLVDRDYLSPWLNARYGIGNYSWTFSVIQSVGWWENQDFEIPATPYHQIGRTHPEVPIAKRPRPHRPR